MSNDKQPIADRPEIPGYGLLTEEEGAGLLPWGWATSKMEAARNYWLVTSSKAGQPHSVPLWGVWQQGGFIFATANNSRKGRNLAANDFAIVHLESGDEVVIVEGRVVQLANLTEADTAAIAYQRKYEVSLVGSAVYRLTPVQAFGWMEADFPGTATRWRFMLE